MAIVQQADGRIQVSVALFFLFFYTFFFIELFADRSSASMAYSFFFYVNSSNNIVRCSVHYLCRLNCLVLLFCCCCFAGPGGWGVCVCGGGGGGGGHIL